MVLGIFKKPKTKQNKKQDTLEHSRRKFLCCVDEVEMNPRELLVTGEAPFLKCCAIPKPRTEDASCR